MASSIESYRRYGQHHGTAMYYDCAKPSPDRFLDYMEKRMSVESFEAYMDGFAEGKLGEHKRKFPFLRSLTKKGSVG